MSKRVVFNQLKVAALSLVIVALVGVIAQQGRRLVATLTPVDTWILVHELTVPNHRVGGDPLVTFQRSVFTGLVGRWQAEIHRVGAEQVCPTGNGEAFYGPDEPDTFRAPLSVYAGGPCRLRPGDYRLTIVNEFSDGLATKRISYSSNVFTVTP